MEDFDLFATKDEALSFIKGLETAVEVLDYSELLVSEPIVMISGDWRVDYNW